MGVGDWESNSSGPEWESDSTDSKESMLIRWAESSCEGGGGGGSIRCGTTGIDHRCFLLPGVNVGGCREI